MNFYPPPPTIKAELYVRIPDELRCIGQETEWRSGFDRDFQHIFLEGPVADDLGNLYVVDIPFGRILRIGADKHVSVIAQWDGEPNGLAATADGDLLIADYKQVQRRPLFTSSDWLIQEPQGILQCEPSTGKVSPKMTRRQLERFKGPNDLIVDSKGNIYFTDQGQSSITDPTGKVYRLCTDGRLDTLVQNGVSPNGLVLSLDERFLSGDYLFMTTVPRPKGAYFQSFGKVGPDGLALDEEDSLFVCHPGLGSIFVVDSDGIPKARIISGTEGVNLTNCCFGGPEGKTLFITDSLEGNVQSVEWHCKGATAPPKLRHK